MLRYILFPAPLYSSFSLHKISNKIPENQGSLLLRLLFSCQHFVRVYALHLAAPPLPNYVLMGFLVLSHHCGCLVTGHKRGLGQVDIRRFDTTGWPPSSGSPCKIQTPLRGCLSEMKPILCCSEVWQHLPFLKRRAGKCRQRHKLPCVCMREDATHSADGRLSTQQHTASAAVATTCRALSLYAGVQRSALADPIRIVSRVSLLVVCLRVLAGRLQCSRNSMCMSRFVVTPAQGACVCG